MKIFKRFKKDKKFRNNVFIGLIIFLFLTQSGALEPQAVSQETCDQYDKIGMFNECKSSGCAVDIANIPVPLLGTFIECQSWLTESMFSCTSSSTTRFLAKDDSTANSLCGGDGKKAIHSESYCFQTAYLCVADPNPACKTWQKPFAGILDGIWKDNPDMSCSTKAYIVMGAGVLLLLAVI